MFQMTAFGRDARCARDIKVRQASEILLVQQHEPVLFVRQHILAELRSKGGQPLGDRGQSRLGLSRRAGAGAGEIEMIALKHARLLGRKAKLVLLGFKRVDALEQRRVQRDFAAMPREHGRDLPLDRLEFVIGRRAREIEEHFGHPIEAASAAFQGFDRIGEGRRLWICRDGVDLSAMVFQRDVESGPEMPGLDAVERGRLERPSPRFEERVLFNVRLGHQCLRMAFANPAATSLSGHRGLIVSDLRKAISGQRASRFHARASNRPAASQKGGRHKGVDESGRIESLIGIPSLSRTNFWRASIRSTAAGWRAFSSARSAALAKTTPSSQFNAQPARIGVGMMST